MSTLPRKGHWRSECMQWLLITCRANIGWWKMGWRQWRRRRTVNWCHTVSMVSRCLKQVHLNLGPNYQHHHHRLEWQWRNSCMYAFTRRRRMLLYCDLAALDVISVVNMRYKFPWSVHRLSIFNVLLREVFISACAWLLALVLCSYALCCRLLLYRVRWPACDRVRELSNVILCVSYRHYFYDLVT